MSSPQKFVELGVTPGITATKDEILALEKKLGVQFPEAFREFLVRYGSCTIGRDLAYPCKDGPPFDVSIFLNLKEIGERTSSFKERLPQLVLPFNEDGSDNFLCISLRADSYGFIYYLDHSLAFDSADPNDDVEKFSENLQFIASDFESLIAGLVDRG